jgi:hypothetical protein
MHRIKQRNMKQIAGKLQRWQPLAQSRHIGAVSTRSEIEEAGRFAIFGHISHSRTTQRRDLSFRGEQPLDFRHWF